MKPEQGSVSQWLEKLKLGQPQAADEIWKRYYSKLLAIASKQLVGNFDRAVEGEDLVQSSFGNVCLAVIEGKYPQVDNRVELWSILYTATINRVRQHFRELATKKRNNGRKFQVAFDASSALVDLKTPQAEAEMADLLEYLLSKLDLEDSSGELRQIAILHLEDHSASAIAKTLRRRKTTILISLRLIRSLWKDCE
ncbi:MAG: ECF-type sigma factor [Pirellula sp.]